MIPHWLGFGTPSDQAYVDLQSMGTTVAQGDAYLAALKFENAVTAYQATAATIQSLNAEIPASPALLTQVQPLDQQLQALTANLASQATAQQAQALAKQIQALYTQAVAAMPPPTAAPAVSAPITTAPAPTNWPAIIAGGVVVAGLVGIVYVLIRGPEMFENPTGGSAGPRKPVKKALINKGRACHFLMAEGPSYHTRGGMLHDPSGRWWPRNSVLCGPFKKVRAAGPDDGSPQSKHYLGDSHRASVGVVDTPPRALSGWEYLGEVEEIRYTRTGRKRPGRYYHPFNKPGALATIVKGKGKARLYKCGRFYRLDLPRNATLDTRGFVWP